MQIKDYLSILGPNAQRGSKPRCHLLTHGERRIVASRLTEIISPWGIVNKDDFWMPEGFDDLSEAELHKATKLLSEEVCLQLKSWWLRINTSAPKTPNWDIASTCTIEGRKGLLLIEAKAHNRELSNEEAPKRLKSGASENSKINHNNIGSCIENAASGLSNATGLLWNLSHKTHYQMANRFAWAWKLTQLDIPVILVYMGFLDANEMEDISKPFHAVTDWKYSVLNHSKTLFPEEVWGKKWVVNNQPFIPIISTCDISWS